MTDRPGNTSGDGAAGWNWNPSDGGNWTPPTEQQAGHGWAPGPPPPQAPRPGVVPLRPLTFGEVLDGAFTMIQRYPAILLGFSAAVYAVVAVLLYFWAGYVGVDAALAPLEQLESLDRSSQMDAMTSAGAAASWFSLGSGLLNWLASAIVTGVITITAARGILGQSVTFRGTWQAFRPRLLRLLGLTILIGLIVASVMVVWMVLLFVIALSGNVAAIVLIGLVGGIAAVVLMIMMAVRLALAPAALVLESHSSDHASGPGSRRPLGIREALRRSWRLVRGRSWRTLGILLVAVLIATVVAGILEYAVTLLGGTINDLFADDSGNTGTALASGIGFVSSGVLQAAVIAAVSVLVYSDARMRTEGLDIALGGALRPGHTGSQPGGTTDAGFGGQSGSVGEASSGSWSSTGTPGPEQPGRLDDPESPWSVP